MTHFSLTGGAAIESALATALAGGPPIAPLPHTDPSAPQNRGVLAMLRAAEESGHPGSGPELLTDCAAVVATSGSTGTPKGVLLSRAAIRAAVSATHERLGGPGDWVLVLPEHYVAGLMVLARSLITGTETRRIAADLTGIGDLPRTARRRYLSVVPTQLIRAMTDEATVTALARFDAVLVGGAAMDPAIGDQLRDRGVRLVTTYGMSETCGGCVYDGLPLPGVEVHSDPATSRLSIAGPMLFSGYLGRPTETAKALEGGRFRTGDRGSVTSGLVHLTGRVDDVVISGGSNVDLAEVESVLRRVLGSRGSGAVIGVPDREWGTRVVAVTDAALTRDDLRPHLSGALLPRQVITLERLPRTDSGKIDRQKLARLLTDDNQE